MTERCPACLARLDAPHRALGRCPALPPPPLERKRRVPAVVPAPLPPRPKGRWLSEAERRVAEIMLDTGATTREVAGHLGCNHSTVARLGQRRASRRAFIESVLVGVSCPPLRFEAEEDGGACFVVAVRPDGDRCARQEVRFDGDARAVRRACLTAALVVAGQDADRAVRGAFQC